MEALKTSASSTCRAAGQLATLSRWRSRVQVPSGTRPVGNANESDRGPVDSLEGPLVSKESKTPFVIPGMYSLGGVRG